MERHGKESTLAEHAFKAGVELDLGDGKRMAQMERTVHIRIRKCAHPLGLLLSNLVWAQIRQMAVVRRVGVEDILLLPFVLVLVLEFYKKVALGCL
jgi:hypothetical protein